MTTQQEQEFRRLMQTLVAKGKAHPSRPLTDKEINHIKSIPRVANQRARRHAWMDRAWRKATQ